jgi:hypothetical protein
MECEHGEPRGPKYCAFCRSGSVQDPTTTEVMEWALDAKKEWTQRATGALLTLAQSGRQFTSDDLVEIVGLPAGTTRTAANNAVGALFARYSRKHLITSCGVKATDRSSSHGRSIRIWVGV